MRFFRSPSSCICLTISIIVIFDFVLMVNGMNMWTALTKRSVPSSKKPVKRCLSPCDIFHTWCKNDGKCRAKGEDCTWYCECPDNCEGFFCEKIVAKETIDPAVEVKVVVQKEEKKPVSAFDKSKLAQALAGIISKKKRGEEDKVLTAPDAIGRVGKNDKITVNVTKTCKFIFTCPNRSHGLKIETSANETVAGVESSSALPTVSSPTIISDNQSNAVENASSVEDLLVVVTPQNISEDIQMENVSNNDPLNVSTVQTDIQITTDNIQITTSNPVYTSTASIALQQVKNKIDRKTENTDRKILVNTVESSDSSSLEKLIEKAIETIPVEKHKRINQTSTPVIVNSTIKPTKSSTISTTTQTIKETTIKLTEKSNSTENKHTSSPGNLSVKGISISDKQANATDRNGLYSARTAINMTSGANLSHDKTHAISKMSTDSQPAIAAGDNNHPDLRASRTSTVSPTVTTLTDTIPGETPSISKIKSKQHVEKSKNKSKLSKQSKISVKTVTSAMEPTNQMKSKTNDARGTSESLQNVKLTDNNSSKIDITTESPKTQSTKPDDAELDLINPNHAENNVLNTTDTYFLTTTGAVERNVDSKPSDSTTKSSTLRKQTTQSKFTTESSKTTSLSMTTTPSTEMPSTIITTTNMKQKTTTKSSMIKATTMKPSTTVKHKRKTTSNKITRKPIKTTVQATTTEAMPSTSVFAELISTTTPPTTSTTSAEITSTDLIPQNESTKHSKDTFSSISTEIVTSPIPSITENFTEASNHTNVSYKDNDLSTTTENAIVNVETKNVNKNDNSTYLPDNKESANVNKSDTVPVRQLVDGANTHTGDNKPVKDVDDMTIVSNKLPEIGKEINLDELKPELVERNIAGQELNNAL